jgi:hypothetical protein
MLCNIDEEHEGYNYVSWWFNIYRNRLDNLGEKLTFEDAVAEDKATQVGTVCSRAIDESGLSSRQHKHN